MTAIPVALLPQHTREMVERSPEFYQDRHVCPVPGTPAHSNHYHIYTCPYCGTEWEWVQ